MAKYNWSELKIAFLNGNYKSLKDFAEERNIPYRTLRKSAVGWGKEKREKTRNIQKEVFVSQIEKGSSYSISRNERILNAQDKLLEFYENISPKDIIEWAKDSPKVFVSLTAGLINLQKIHRLAEGLDKASSVEDASAKLDKLCEAIKDVKKNE